MFTIVFADGTELNNLDGGDRANLINHMGRSDAGSAVAVYIGGAEYVVNANQILYIKPQ